MEEMPSSTAPQRITRERHSTPESVLAHQEAPATMGQVRGWGVGELRCTTQPTTVTQPRDGTMDCRVSCASSMSQKPSWIFDRHYLTVSSQEHFEVGTTSPAW